MSALNFQVFVDKVEDGRKRQTIRAFRKRPFRVGERLHLFTGMRTKACRRLSPSWIEHRCKRLRKIEMTFRRAWRGDAVESQFTWSIKVDGVGLLPGEAWRIAKADGFEGLGAFLRFFFKASKLVRNRPKRTTQFPGQIINW